MQGLGLEIDDLIADSQPFAETSEPPRQLTVSVPSMPASRWPGTEQ